MRALLPLLISAALVASACSSPPDVPPGADGEPDPILVEGRELFGRSCQSCHGSAGGGGRGPNITGETMVGKYTDIDDQIEVVTSGRNQMPAFGDKLSATEIEAVVRYTREVL